MLYWLLYLKLFHYFPPFRIFRYLTFRTAFASLTALFTGLIVGPDRHPAAARISDRTVHPRRRSAGAPEKSRHAHHGRPADRHRHPGSHLALGRPEQSVCLDRRAFHAGLRRHRFCRRLPQGRSSPQSRPYRARQAGLADRGQRPDCRRADRPAVPRRCTPPG